MNNEEFRKEKQKVYDNLINSCIGKRVINTAYYMQNATAYYENDVTVCVSETMHMFYIGREAKTFSATHTNLDLDYQEFVLETAKIDEEKQQALKKVEEELRNRKARVQRIEELNKFAEKFKAT